MLFIESSPDQLQHHDQQWFHILSVIRFFVLILKIIFQYFSQIIQNVNDCVIRGHAGGRAGVNDFNPRVNCPILSTECYYWYKLNKGTVRNQHNKHSTY